MAGLASRGRNRAVLLGVAAGLADCCMSVATMVFAHAAGHGVSAVATSWGTYALIVVGAGSLILTQSAFQAGRPTVTLPIITVITPAFSAVVGTCFLGQSAGLDALSIAAAVAAATLATAGLVSLARCPDGPDAADDPIVQPFPAPAPPTPVRPAPEADASGSAADAALVIAQLWVRRPCHPGSVMM